MSYILDALRRAESERQQGQVPGLHDAAAAPVLAGTAPAGSRLQLWWWLPVALLLLAAAAWWAWPRPAGVVAATPLPQPALPPAVQPTASAPALQPAPAPLPVVVSAPPAPAAVPAPGPATAASAPERALRFSELSAEMQRALPSLLPSGSVWSDQPAARFVVLNGQVLREGDTVAPGLVLERLQPKSALLRWRGLLIELPL